MPTVDPDSEGEGAAPPDPRDRRLEYLRLLSPIMKDLAAVLAALVALITIFRK
ncbi:hypothetical protein OG792_11000 [Micromonospora sp. NBC_01699]|uniref:hypothetical protein n=1 Tax=Micromonospora sp. NBC_01699 TaxID=2975984 RepID=UPI002E33C69C|nr:hypothetical protein [Micromonospora sp. NBC_01699]